VVGHDALYILEIDPLAQWSDIVRQRFNVHFVGFFSKKIQ